ncbi:hypothetical protein ACFLVX_01930 [Chloroflexota bacterium]
MTENQTVAPRKPTLEDLSEGYLRVFEAPSREYPILGVKDVSMAFLGDIMGVLKAVLGAPCAFMGQAPLPGIETWGY